MAKPSRKELLLINELKKYNFTFGHSIEEYENETIIYDFICVNNHINTVSFKSFKRRDKKCKFCNCIKLDINNNIIKINNNIINNYEHVCRQVFIFLINHIGDNKIEQFELKNYEKKDYYTINELIEITNYNNIQFYAPRRRPKFLKINNLNENIDTGNYLEIDCFCKELHIGLEVDSDDHYKQYSLGSKAEKEKFERQVKLDNIKNEKCKENNIILLRISYEIYKLGIKEIKRYLYNEFIKLDYVLSISLDEFMEDNIILNNMINNNSVILNINIQYNSKLYHY